MKDALKISDELVEIYDRRELLKVSNPFYLQDVKRFLNEEIAMDVTPNGDLTTNCLFFDKEETEVVIIAKASGIIAGIEEVCFFLNDLVEVATLVKDGDFVIAGTKVLRLKGSVRTILSVERAVLNVLMRMSGVASHTANYVETVKGLGVPVLATRKLLLGLLDKKAVALGGGLTHRLNLSDAIMIKDTHKTLYASDWPSMLSQLLSSEFSVAKFLEFEVESFSEFRSLTEALIQNFRFLPQYVIVLLDNFALEEVVKVKEFLMKDSDLNSRLIIECSGGLNLDTAKLYAKAGAHAVSIGDLTTGAKSLDMSLRVS